MVRLLIDYNYLPHQESNSPGQHAWKGIASKCIYALITPPLSLLRNAQGKSASKKSPDPVLSWQNFTTAAATYEPWVWNTHPPHIYIHIKGAFSDYNYTYLFKKVLIFSEEYKSPPLKLVEKCQNCRSIVVKRRYCSEVILETHPIIQWW